MKQEQDVEDNGMKRRDKGWGEADSQRAQSTSQPKSARLKLTGRPADAVRLHVYFAHHVDRHI